MIEVLDTDMKDVRLIKPQVFADHRGEYVETYGEALYRQKGIDIKFVEDDISVSKKNVLRGLHGDNETWKLVSCLYGRFLLVVVNCRPESPEFGKWQSFELSEKTAGRC